MSAQGSQWARRCSPKQGPMKATLPMSSLTRQNSNINYSRTDSPCQSPTSLWKCRISPDQSRSGIRSPGAINYKGKSKCFEEGCRQSCMRRTASLDTIYLSGQWPREHSLYLYSDLLQIDRSTQTDDWLGESKKISRFEQTSDDKYDKYIRHRVRGWSGGLGGRVGSPSGEVTQRHRLRSSVEGLNQEIEKLVLTSPSSLALDKKGSMLSTPEGHRAPLAELLRQTRSVNTQTPAYSSQSSGPPSRESPMVNNISRPPSESQGGSEDSSPEHEARGSGASPRINRFLAREPPDGCERVCLKFIETDTRKAVIELSEINYPLKPSMNFQLKPSLGSAFHPLRSMTQTQESTPTQ